MVSGPVKERNGNVLFSENWALLGLFMLAAMNFQAKFFYFVFAAVLVHIVLHGSIRIDQSIIWYVVFTIVYATYAFRMGWIDTIRKFAFIGCYVLGFNTMYLVSENGGWKRNKQERWLEACIGALAIGSWLHLMLNFMINRGGSVTRNTIDIWTGQAMSATGQAALAVLMLATGIVWSLLPRGKVMRWLGVGAVVSILFYNLALSGRTLVALSALLLFIASVYIFVNRQFSTYHKRQTVKILILLLICIAVVFTYDVAGIRSEVLESNLAERFEGAETTNDLLADGRMENKAQYLKNMLEYPFGGLRMRRQYGYAHDLLLDAYDECGIFMFISLIGILLSSMRDTWKVLRSINISARLKCLIICFYLAIYVEFSIEPIFAGMPWLFACFALINGCVRGVACTNE